MGHREYLFLKNLQNHENFVRVFSHSSNGMMAAKVLKDSNKSVNAQQSNVYNVLDKGFDYMAMEFCPNGDLFDLIKKNGKLQEGLAKHLFLQLLEAVEFLHSKEGVAHLDLKPENILIGNHYQLKICDFGFFEEIKSKVHKSVGTNGYRAPETYLDNGEGYDGSKADMFSLGVILFILIFGVPPFCMATREDPLYRLFYRGPSSYKFFLRLHYATKQLFLSGGFDMDLVEILFALLDENPETRPKSISEIKQFNYLKKDVMSNEEAQYELKKLINNT